jgi:hypothetical protein
MYVGHFVRLSVSTISTGYSGTLVFFQSIFSDPTPSYEPADELVDVNLLQATYFICILQKWDGTSTAKIRVQRDRFTCFVAVCEKNPNIEVMEDTYVLDAGNQGNGAI